MFALDISENRIRIIELLKTRGRFTLNALGEKEFSSKEALPDAIKELSRETKPSSVISREAAIAIPEEESFIKIIQLPKNENGDPRDLLKKEISKLLPYGAEDIYWDWKVTGGDENHIDCIVAASPKTVIDAYAEMIHKTGFELALIETQANALLWGAINPLKNFKIIQPTLVLNLDTVKINIVIFANGMIRFTNSAKMETGEGGHIYENIPLDKTARKNVQEFTKDWLLTEKNLLSLVSKLREYIDYYEAHLVDSIKKEEDLIKDIIVCGAWADFPELINFLKEKLQMNVKGPDNIIPVHPEYTTALGLALRALYEEDYD